MNHIMTDQSVIIKAELDGAGNCDFPAAMRL
jgi:hypothetical protein